MTQTAAARKFHLQEGGLTCTTGILSVFSLQFSHKTWHKGTRVDVLHRPIQAKFPYSTSSSIFVASPHCFVKKHQKL